MTVLDVRLSSRVTKVLDVVRNFTAHERIVLAKLLLDSIVADETDRSTKDDISDTGNGVHSKPKPDLEAFANAAGSWHDMDADAFVRAVREQRDQSYRPPVDL